MTQRTAEILQAFQFSQHAAQLGPVFVQAPTYKPGQVDAQLQYSPVKFLDHVHFPHLALFSFGISIGAINQIHFKNELNLFNIACESASGLVKFSVPEST